VIVCAHNNLASFFATFAPAFYACERATLGGNQNEEKSRTYADVIGCVFCFCRRSYANSNTDTDAGAYSDSDTHTNANGDSDTDVNADSDADVNANAEHRSEDSEERAAR
jgi:hypothetical protein